MSAPQADKPKLAPVRRAPASSVVEAYSDDDLEAVIVAMALQLPSNVDPGHVALVRGASRRRLLAACVDVAPGASADDWPAPVVAACPELLRPRDVVSYRRHAAALLVPFEEVLGEARKRAALRDARERIGRADAHLREGGLDVPEARAELEAAARVLDEGPVASGPRWLTPAERALQLGSSAPRMSTGLATLDEWTRGGFVGGKVVAICGAPGAGKTTLAGQLARRYHGGGHAVAILACDEDADAILIRWGQAEGLVREQLESGHPDARRVLAEAVDSPRLLLVDGDEDQGATVELVAGRLATLAGATSLPGVLVVDSIQTARVDAADASLERRTSVDLVVAALRRTAKVHGHLVIATSEVGRAYYRDRHTAPSSALAAGKESGGIEYGVGVQLVLASVAGESDVIAVTVAKSRLGRHDAEAPAFRLRLDRARASLDEVDAPPVERDRDPTEADAKMLVELVRLSPVPLTGQRALVALLRGIGKSRKESAVAHAIAHGWLVGGGKKTPYSPGDRAPLPPQGCEPAVDDWGAPT